MAGEFNFLWIIHLKKNIEEIDGVATKIAIERTLSEIEKIINYVLKAKIYTE